MGTVNPYAAPRAAVEDVQSAEPELATLWQRFAASFIDGIVVGGAVVAAILASGTGAGAASPGSAGLMAVFLIIALAIVGGINLWMMRRYRATIGKRVLKIRMVRADGSEAGIARLVFLRGLPQWILSGLGNYVPFVGLLSLIDVLFVFGNRRRCVHDYIADTIVVKAE